MSATVKAAAGALAAEIRSALAENGVVWGLMDDAIETARSQPGELVKVAAGKEPIPPRHGYVEYFIGSKDAPLVKIRDDDRADYKELNLIENVTEGFILARLIPPEPGSPGCNVRGRELPPKPAVEAKLKFRGNVKLSPDETEIIATSPGRARVEPDGTVIVEDVYVVGGDVGPETGNIDFVGSVEIKGNVLTGFQVKAAKMVTIKGSVEGSTVIGGQGIKVAEGIFGGGKAVLHTPGDIHCRSAQDARLYAGGEIVAEDSLIRVSAVAAKKIVAEKGSIIGGALSAPDISAVNLGAEAHTRTIIEIGISPRVRLTCSRLEIEFGTIRGALLKLRERLHTLHGFDRSGKVMSEEDRETMERLEKDESKLIVKILEIAADISKLVRAKESSIPGKLTATGTVFPGTVISTLVTEQEAREERKSLVVEAVEGKLTRG